MGAYEDVTNRIVAAIESGLATGKGYRMPWHSTGGRPVNVASGRAYRGINVLMLWGEAQERGLRCLPCAPLHPLHRENFAARTCIRTRASR